MSSGYFDAKLRQIIRITSTNLLVGAILLCISGMALLGYRELARFSSENADLRLDRASITAVLLAKHWLPEFCNWEPGEHGTPNNLVLGAQSAEQMKDLVPRFEGLTREVSLSNQGAANIFVWDAASATYDRIVTTLRKPDGSLPPAARLTSAHPAYANVTAGKAFRGNVPVAGRMRYAFLIPILSETRQILGIFATDVGWSDDLVAAKNNLQTKFVLIALIMGSLLMAAAFTSLFLLKAPLDALRAALNKSSGDAPAKVSNWMSVKGGELQDIALGIQRLKRQVGLDVLTGLGNRQCFEEAMARIAAIETPVPPHLKLMLMDLDHFKQVNDSLGHLAGDAVLIEVANRLRDILPKDVTICRNGGDEFAIVAEIANVASVAQSIIKAIEQPILVDGKVARVSCSIGILNINGAIRDTRMLYNIVDMALYAAKQNGRGRFCFADSEQAGTSMKKIA